MGSPADATMAEMMDGALAQRLRDEELARRIGKALAGKRPTLEDLPKFASSARRDEGVGRSVDARAEEPWGAFERRRASTEEQRRAVFAPAASAPVTVAPPARRRGARWPWIVAATIATGVAVQLAAPQWWPAVGQHATQGIAWMRDATRGGQPHGDPARPLAMSAIATPSVDVDTEVPAFVPYPMPVVVTTAPRVVPVSAAIPPPPPPRPEPVVEQRRSPRSVGTPRKSDPQVRPVARGTAVNEVTPATDATVDATTEAPAISIPEPRTTPEHTTMADPSPKPIPREDPPRETPEIEEPPPPDTPPNEVPEIRDPPPTDVPTQGTTAQ